MVKNVKRLTRNTNNKVIAGVCSGIADYLNIDPVIVRVVWACCIFLWGFGILAYLLAWIIIPVRK